MVITATSPPSLGRALRLRSVVSSFALWCQCLGSTPLVVTERTETTPTVMNYLIFVGQRGSLLWAWVSWLSWRKLSECYILIFTAQTPEWYLSDLNAATHLSQTKTCFPHSHNRSGPQKSAVTVGNIEYSHVWLCRKKEGSPYGSQPTVQILIFCFGFWNNLWNE